MPSRPRVVSAVPVSRLFAGASLAVLLGGCVQILGIEGLSPGDGDAGPRSDGGVPVDARIDPPADALIDAPVDAPTADLSCAEGELSEPLGSFTIDTSPAGDDFSATCGGAGSPDSAIAWHAPVTDYYVFHTFGSDYDTVLALFDECGGQELSCSNNVGQSVQSEVVHKFVQGQGALLLLDGAVGDSGSTQLSIERVSCPSADLEGQSFPVQLSTLGFGDDFSGACGGSGAEDRAYHWVAPADGLYYFRATSEVFKPIVSVVDGPRCSDLVLGCNLAAAGDLGAEVVRFLRAGQVVSVLIDGDSSGGSNDAGLFELDIGIREAPSCPAGELTLETGIIDSFASQRSLSPSCGAVYNYGAFGGEVEARDKTYRVTIPADGSCFRSYEFQATSDSEQVLIYALRGSDCGGEEVQCALGVGDATGGQASASISLSALDDEEQEFTIVVVDPAAPFAGAENFTVQSFRYEACP